jgi:hypothetical protein
MGWGVVNFMNMGGSVKSCSSVEFWSSLVECNGVSGVHEPTSSADDQRI